MQEVAQGTLGPWNDPHAMQGSGMVCGTALQDSDRPRRKRGCSWGPQGEAGDEEDKRTKVAEFFPQETSVPQELLVTVLKPGLPTLADLYVLLPPPRPTRKRSLSSDKVCPVAIGLPGPPCTARGSGHLQQAGTSQWLMA